MATPVTSIAVSPCATSVALATPESVVVTTPPPPPPAPTSAPLPLPLPASSTHRLPHIAAIAHPSSRTLYTATTRGTLTRYALAPTPTATFSVAAAHSTHPLTAVAALSPSSLVATAAKDGVIKLWDPTTATATAKLAAHRYEVRSLALAASLDGAAPVTLIASAGRDKTVRLWDSRADAPVATLRGHSGWVHAVALASHPSPIAVSCAGDKSVRVWDLLTMSPRETFTGHEYRVWDVALPVTATYCVSASTDATVRAWEIGGEGRHSYDAHNDSVLCVAAARDGHFVVSGCEDGSVFVWGSRGLFGHQPGEDDLVAEEGPVTEEPIEEEKPLERALPKTEGDDLVDVGGHVQAPFEGVPKQMDTTPLVAVEPQQRVDQAPQPIVEDVAPDTVEAVYPKPAETQRPASHLSAQMEDTEALKAAIALPPQQAPAFDKSAAELVRALQHVNDLEKALREAGDKAALKDRELAALKASLVERDTTIMKLRAEVETSKALVREAGVHALLDAHPRKADVALDYDEPVNKIGAVSDKLSRLAARLDAMIATT